MKRYFDLYIWACRASYDYIAPGWWDLRFWVKLPWKYHLIAWWTIRDQNRAAKCRGGL